MGAECYLYYSMERAQAQRKSPGQSPGRGKSVVTVSLQGENQYCSFWVASQPSRMAS